MIAIPEASFSLGEIRWTCLYQPSVIPTYTKGEIRDMTKFQDHKRMPIFPREGETFEVLVYMGFTEDPDTNGKYIVHLSDGRKLSLWQSQFDMLHAFAQGQNFPKTLKIGFNVVQGTAGKRRLLPIAVEEKL